MAIDASIYNALSQPRKSAFDYANQFEEQAYQREQRGTQRQMNALQLQQAQQGAAEDAALRSYLSGGADLNTPEGQAGLYKVAPKAAGGVIKSQLEAADLKAKTRAHESSAKSSEASAAKTQFETEQARRQQHLQELVGVQDVPGAMAWLDAAQASGELPPDRVAMAKQQLQANPQSLGQWKQGAIAGGFTLQQQREQEWKAREFGLKQDQYGETVRHNKAREGLQAGQLDVSRGNLGVAQANLGVSRDRLALDRSKAATSEQQPKLTESQAKASTYLGQMKAASRALEELAPDQSNPLEQARVAAAGGTLTNFAAGPKGQQVRQAQEQWAEAFLRHKTGAAATEPEVKRNLKTFFPQMMDSEEVIRQKALMRQQAESDMEISAGAGAQRVKVVGGSGGTPQGAPKSIKTIKTDSDYNSLPSGAVFVGPDGKTRRKP